MKLTHLMVENFRSLYSTGWFPIHDLTVFIGQNDGGKTSALRALSLFLSKNRVPSKEDFSINADKGEREDTITISAKLSVDVEGNNISSDINSNEILLKKVIKDNGEHSYLMYSKKYENDLYNIDFESETLPKLKSFAEENEINLTNKTTKSIVIKDIKNYLDENEYKVDGWVSASSEIINKLPRLEILTDKQGDPQSLIHNTLRMVFRDEINKPEHQKALKVIEDDIKKVLDEKLTEVVPFIKKYFDEVEKIDTSTDFNYENSLRQTTLNLETSHGKLVDLERRGDGKKRQVTLAVYEWDSDLLKKRGEESQNLILALDEPDTHLDYDSQRKLLNIINGFVSEKVQVIVSTHSMNFIDSVPATKINHFKLDSDYQTSINFYKFNDDLPSSEEDMGIFIHEVGRNLGLTTGAIFYEKCFLLVEGPTEMNALPLLYYKKFGRLMREDGICLINGENNYSALQFAQFLNENHRNVVFMVDSDSKVQGKTKRLFTEENLIEKGFDVEKQVVFAGDMEFEDAFENEIWVKVAKNYYGGNLDKELDFDDFQQLRIEGKFSSSLSKLFRESKPNIAKALVEEVDIEKLPNCIEQVFRVSQAAVGIDTIEEKLVSV